MEKLKTRGLIRMQVLIPAEYEDAIETYKKKNYCSTSDALRRIVSPALDALKTKYEQELSTHAKR